MNAGSSIQPASFGPYEILGLLGQGGGGEVHRAWDPRLEREVALKILRERVGTDPERLRRFVAEARAASALNHPNIVTVFDAVVDGDTPYIVSELIDGKPLRVEIGRGPVPLKRLLDLATQIADGLSAAHEAGIVHRDLKPENIMVTRDGTREDPRFRPGAAGRAAWRVRARHAPAADDVQTQTELGLRAGTIPYMSPEQARGAATDFRSDQFSFGLILYEMAAGRPAFRRDTPAATLDAIINDELPPMSALDARTPLMLRWIIERCLAKDPADRYAVTADLHRDLRTLRDRLGEAVSRETGGLAAAAPTIWRRAPDRRRACSRHLSPAPMLVRCRRRSGAGRRVRAALHAVRDSARIRGVPCLVARRTDHRVRRRGQRNPADFHATAFVAGVRTGHPCVVRLQASLLVAGRETHLLRIAGEGQGMHMVGRGGGRHAPGGHRRTQAAARSRPTAGRWRFFATNSVPTSWAPRRFGFQRRSERNRRDIVPFRRSSASSEGVLSFSPDGSKLGVCAVAAEHQPAAGRARVAVLDCSAAWRPAVPPPPVVVRCGPARHQLRVAARQPSRRARGHLALDAWLASLDGRSRA